MELEKTEMSRGSRLISSLISDGKSEPKKLQFSSFVYEKGRIDATQ